MPEPRGLALDPAAAPARIPCGRPQHQLLDRLRGPWSAGCSGACCSPTGARRAFGATRAQSPASPGTRASSSGVSARTAPRTTADPPARTAPGPRAACAAPRSGPDRLPRQQHRRDGQQLPCHLIHQRDNHLGHGPNEPSSTTGLPCELQRRSRCGARPATSERCCGKTAVPRSAAAHSSRAALVVATESVPGALPGTEQEGAVMMSGSTAANGVVRHRAGQCQRPRRGRPASWRGCRGRWARRRFRHPCGDRCLAEAGRRCAAARTGGRRAWRCGA